MAMFDSLLASRPRASEGSTKATIISVATHAAIVIALIYAPARAADIASDGDPVFVPLVQDEPVHLTPPPPTDVTPPATPAPLVRGFTALSVPDVVPPDIPPPQAAVRISPESFEPIGVRGGSSDSAAVRGSVGDLTAAPRFTPMDVPPKLLNRDQVGAAIARNYPTMLRDAGIVGTTKVWFYIDQSGHSIQHVVKTSSGYAALDSAALRVAPIMRFTPAQMQDKVVPVWVAIDVVFTIR